MNLTKITAQFPPILTKVIDVDAEGNLTKKAAAHLSRGFFETKNIDTLAKLKSIIESLNSNEVLVYGIPVNGDHKGTIASRKQAANGDITRTREAFCFSNRQCWLMLDIDKSDEIGAPDTSWSSIYSFLDQCVENFSTTVPHLRGHSAGSFIYRKSDGEELIGERGKRIYIPVIDGGDIPRAGKALSKRLKAKGSLHFGISSCGTFLERGLIDEAVFQPERIDFCAGAVCSGDCFQRRPEMEIMNDGKPALDTEIKIKDLSKIEEQEIWALTVSKQAPLQEKAREIRETWLAAHQKNRPTHLSAEEYRELLINAADEHVLGADFPIVLANEGNVVLVGELLADPRRYNGCLCLDPMEPDYNNKSVVGKIYLGGARPLIYSMAHGSQKFFLTRKRHQVFIADGCTEATTDTCLRLLRGNNVLYRRGKYLAEISEGKINALLEPNQVESHLDRQIQFIKRTKKSSHPADCPYKVARRLMCKQSDWGFFDLRGIVQLPVMRLNGSVMDTPGFDSETGLLYDTEPEAEGCSVIMNPTRTDVENALIRLWQPFRAFPFANDESRGSVLAAILTSAVRPVLPTAPGFLINAPAYGTGKTLLARALGALSGSTPTLTGWPKTNEEQEKLLSSILREGAESLILDNLDGNLTGASLSGIMTSPTWSARILGKSEKMEVSTNTLLFATGNNVYAIEDTARRFCVIRIDAVSEHPEWREFDFNPLSLVQSNQAQFRADALTVLRGYVSAGCPKVEGSTLGSFEDWDRLVRRCICWIIQEGMAPVAMTDPIRSQDENAKVDPGKQKEAQLINAWFGVFGPKVVSAADLKKFCEVGDAPLDSWSEERIKEFDTSSLLLKEALAEISDDRRGRGTINTRILGWFLDRHKDAIVGDLVLRRSPVKTGNRVHYCVEPVR